MVTSNDLVPEISVFPDTVLRNVCTELGRDEVPRAARYSGIDHPRLEL
jgi:hypothetical protein